MSKPDLAPQAPDAWQPSKPIEYYSTYPEVSRRIRLREARFRVPPSGSGLGWVSVEPDGDFLEPVQAVLEAARNLCPVLAAQAQDSLDASKGDPTKAASACRELIGLLRELLAIVREAERLKRTLRKAHGRNQGEADRHYSEQKQAPEPTNPTKPTTGRGPEKLPRTLPPQADRPEQFGLTMREAARLMNVCSRTVRTWIVKHGLPHVRVGRTVRILPDALRAWLAEQQSRLSDAN